MNRVFLVTGPWQMILVGAALREESAFDPTAHRDHLLLYCQSLSATGRALTRQIAERVWKWEEVQSVDEHLNLLGAGFTARDLAKAESGVRSVLAGVDKPDQIWIAKLWDRCEKAVLDCWPECRIVLYEDGLHSYAPMAAWQLWERRFIEQPWHMAHRLKQYFLENGARVERIRERRYCREDLARVDKVYAALADMLPMPQYLKGLSLCRITKGSLREVVRAVASLVSSEEGPARWTPPERPALILGQCFAMYNELSWEQELEAYVHAGLKLSDLGYTPVWKEHPRVRPPFKDAFLARVPSARALEGALGDAWPIEVLTERLGLIACASITSTALYYLRLLFELPTYTFAAQVVQELHREHRELAELTIGCIPALHEVDAAVCVR